MGKSVKSKRPVKKPHVDIVLILDNCSAEKISYISKLSGVPEQTVVLVLAALDLFDSDENIK